MCYNDVSLNAQSAPNSYLNVYIYINESDQASVCLGINQDATGLAVVKH